ncbi:MAG: aminotransferase class V-fold PLP-dependent enzyme [Gemmatimonadota bacterium]|nr:MAG: aminotransferase class V-fold PLP-dependent enzyme [Gemmatimonadota bacterium]
MTLPNRRAFLRHMAGGATAAALAQSLFPDPARGTQVAPIPLPAQPPNAAIDEAYWDLVVGQFSLRPGLIMMNAANLCPAPYSVSQAVVRFTDSVNSDASFQNRAKFGELRTTARHALAQYVGAHPDEIAITRNTSEGNNTIVNGLPLGPGEEVVIWDQNHPTNNVSWDVRAERYGFRVIRVSTPPKPESSDELLQPFAQAITRNTKAMAFSHVSNVSGVTLPAKALCSLARERGIFTLVDGAQTFGALSLDLHDMGCDAFTGSSHKWFVGPKEAGVLYVRSERVPDVWPSDVGVGWDSALENGAQKFENLGQRDDAAVSAMGTTTAFHETIGRDRVERRIRDLANAIKQGLSATVSGISFHTPRDPDLSAGVVVFVPPNLQARDLFNTLYSDHAIAGASMGGDFTGVRLSPHIYNTMAEVDRVVEVVAELT